MPLGLGLGLGIGKGNIYPPASAFPSIDAIPPGALVLDSDGVVKEKVGDFLIPVPVTIIGSGPIASAPSASYPAGAMWWDNVTGIPWISIDGEWALTDYPDVGDDTLLIDENGTILIDDEYTVLVEV